MSTTAILSAVDLSKLGRELPKQLQLQLEGRSGQLVLTSYSRHLPGRRLAGVGTWQGVPVFIKLFFGQRKLKTLGAHRGKQEFQRELGICQALAQSDVSAPELLDHGRIAGGGYWLVQELLPSLRSFKECWQEAANDDERLTLFTQLAHLTQDLFRAGLYQADPHRENFAFSGDRLYALDAGGMKRLRSRVTHTVLDNLALVVAQFDWQYHSRLVEICRPMLPEFKLNESDLLIAVAAAWRQRIRKLSHKMLRASTRISLLKSRNLKARCVHNLLTPELQALLSSSTALDQAINDGQTLKNGNSATVALISVAGTAYVLKRYNIKNRWVALKRVVRASRAQTSWLAGHTLTLMGIPTSAPVAMVEETRWGLRQRAYFLAEVVAGEDAYHRLHTVEPTDAVLQGFSHIFAGMLYTRLSHGDMKATNFMINGEQVSLIDLDAVALHSSSFGFHRAIEKDFQRFLANWKDSKQLSQQFSVLIQGVSNQYRF